MLFATHPAFKMNSKKKVNWMDRHLKSFENSWHIILMLQILLNFLDHPIFWKLLNDVMFRLFDLKWLSGGVLEGKLTKRVEATQNTFFKFYKRLRLKQGKKKRKEELNKCLDCDVTRSGTLEILQASNFHRFQFQRFEIRNAQRWRKEIMLLDHCLR